MSRLDIRTALFLYIGHAKVLKLTDTKEIEVKQANPQEVYIFENYDEYINYFKKYIQYVDEDVIDLPILTTGKKGQIVAFKGLCEKIIIKERIKEFYGSFYRTKVDKIHSKGKITPLEKVKEYESLDLCAPGDAIGSAGVRCKYFSNCHDCLLEYCSHKEEYDKIDLQLVNSGNIQKQKAL